MVSFANNKYTTKSYGGKIIIGINDNHEIEVFTPKQKHEEYITNVARDKCYPSIDPGFEKVSVKNKTVYVVTIPKMINTPYQIITKDGKSHRIRVNSTIREPTTEELTKLYSNKQQAERISSTSEIPNNRNFKALVQIEDKLRTIRLFDAPALVDFFEINVDLDKESSWSLERYNTSSHIRIDKINEIMKSIELFIIASKNVLSIEVLTKYEKVKYMFDSVQTIDFKKHRLHMMKNYSSAFQELICSMHEIVIKEINQIKNQNDN